MALRKQRTPEAIAALAAALGDEDASVRYMAASTLQYIGGDAVVAALRAVVARSADDVARAEAEKILVRLAG
jgi:HEAT repeat protein